MSKVLPLKCCGIQQKSVAHQEHGPPVELRVSCQIQSLDIIFSQQLTSWSNDCDGRVRCSQFSRQFHRTLFVNLLHTNNTQINIKSTQTLEFDWHGFWAGFRSRKQLCNVTFGSYLHCCCRLMLIPRTVYRYS